MYEVVFFIQASDELENAGKWYAERQAGLDKKFIESTLNAIEKLQSDKIIYKPIYKGLSRVLVKRFPYIVYFKKDSVNKLITIYGVLHMRQSKSGLKKRI